MSIFEEPPRAANEPAFFDVIGALSKQFASLQDEHSDLPGCDRGKLARQLKEFCFAVLGVDPLDECIDYEKYQSLIENARIMAHQAGFPNGLRDVLGDEYYYEHFEIG